MISYAMEPGPVHLIRLNTDADLLDGITAFAEENEITTAWLTYLGAVRRASLRYYDQEEQEYRDFVIEEPLEVVSGVGNVSIVEGRPFVHTHAAFADSAGAAFGGHLNTGTIVWAIEIRLQRLLGPDIVRLPDDCTSLDLWGGTL